ncbi:MAG: 2-phospho-L-lactate guanylyltransferase [Solirubrobacterales bacterium]
MSVAAIIPVKRFPAAKSRLASALGSAGRAAVAEAMLTDVLAACGSTESLDEVVVVTGELRAQRAAARAGARVVADPADRGHSDAALLGIAACPGADAVALLPGDCPLLDAGELDRALAALTARSEAGPAVTVVPDRHRTGTNALLLAPPTAIEPAFGPGSRDRHVELARGAGASVEVARLDSLALDLDTPDDLDALAAAVTERPELATTRILSELAAEPSPDALHR